MSGPGPPASRTGVRFGGALGRLFDRRGRRVADDALRTAFPELGSKARARLAGESARVRAAVEHDGTRLLRLPPRVFCRRLHHEGWEHLHTATHADRGLILASAPAGSWRIAFHAAGLYRPRLAATVVDEIGADPTDEPALAAALATGDDVGVAVTPEPAAAAEPGALRFLGRPARVSTLAPRLALAAGVAILPVFALPLGRGRYRLVFREALVAAGDPADPAAVTALGARLLATIEDVVREAPASWPWTG